MQHPIESLGKTLMLLGVVVFLVGFVLSFMRSLRIGSLPGDMSWSGRGWHVAIPLGSSILISLILTLLLNVFLRRR